MSSIDAYQPYDGQRTCHSSEMPGVADFRNLLNLYFGPHNSGILRACGQGGQSEHKEGRALDYSVRVGDPTAYQILDWVLKEDEHRNPHAFGRRFGLMYIIFDRRIFRFHRPEQGWQPYTGSNPHTDHIHFSFGWPGALKRTSWWTTLQRTRSGNSACGATTVTRWGFDTGYGRLVQVKSIDDRIDGRRYENQLAVYASPWRMVSPGQSLRANAPMPVSANPVVQRPSYGGTCTVTMTQ